jgi:glycosyltransferase involved in cell wall biosynthesis
MSGESTHVVLNAVALQDWTPGVGRSAARAEFGYAPDDLVVLTVCRLFAEKGPEELIRAVAALREEVPRVRLLVVGEDNESSQAFAHRLRNLVIETDLGGCVIFAGRRSDVPALMAGADVFAMPSFEEPFGLVFAEAMAMELPVVALDSGGAPEVLVHGENGLLSRPGDLDGLVANLATLLGDPDLRRAMGRSGRRRVEKRFVVERQGRDVAAVYRLVSSGRSVRPGGGCGGGFDGRRD